MFGGTGDFPGVRGVAHMQGGQGGDGGDGDPPGAGGSGGLLEGDPEGFPNGTDGFVGSYCKVAPAWDAYFLVSVRHDVQTAVSWLEILISVLAGDPEPLPGASVTVRMTRPDGGDEVLTGVTGPDGTVELTFEISVYGDYTLTVEDIQAAGYVNMPELNAASSVTARVGPAEGPLAVGDDRLRAFYEEFNAAFAAGDHETLYTGLHPAVLERYGESTCRGYLENVVASPLEVDQISLEDFGAWIWETDGLASEIAHTYTMLGRVTAAGASAEQDLHLALRDDGSLSWFSDCGDPLP
jgi:hypothetical protein